MNDGDDIRRALMAAPDWQNLNAYERTKRCCAELTQRGQRLPSWMSLRDIIGKGSANDINRGKDDFRREHGEALTQMNGVVRGVPEALAPHILGFWTAALAEVRAEFAAQVTDWQARIERADAAAAHAEAEREQAIHHADTLHAQIEGLQAAQATLQGRVATEQAAREQAERMFDANRQELAEQRDELRAALAHSQKELSAAITRLEGVETHALREVMRARTEAQEKIAGIEAKASREKDEHTIEMARLNNQLRDLRAELIEASQTAAVQEQSNASLRERLERAEAQADRLASENAQLVASLQQTAMAQRQPSRRKTPIRKKQGSRAS